MATVRTPTSAPVARTIGVTRSTGRPSTSRVIVVPSELLLGNPVPALTYSSVPFQGPTMADYFRRQGRDYQTRINAVLRVYYESQRSRRPQ